MSCGIDSTRIFRTDRGDDEGVDEWDYGREAGSSDPIGDDDVEILLRADKPVEVVYRKP